METRTHLNQLRQQRGISASQLARLAGVIPQTIYAIEAGEYVPNNTLVLHLRSCWKCASKICSSLRRMPGCASFLTVDRLAGQGAARKGQPVQLCRVGKRTVGVPALPQPMLPMADGVIVESSARSQQAEVTYFRTTWTKISGCWWPDAIRASRCSRSI